MVLLSDAAIEALKTHPETKIDLDSYDHNQERITALIHALNQNPQVLTLSLSHSNLSNELAILLTSLQYITNIDLSFNNITDDAAHTLIQHSVFKTVNLNNNNIQDQQTESSLRKLAGDNRTVIFGQNPCNIRP